MQFEEKKKSSDAENWTGMINRCAHGEKYML